MKKPAAAPKALAAAPVVPDPSPGVAPAPVVPDPSPGAVAPACPVAFTIDAIIKPYLVEGLSPAILHRVRSAVWHRTRTHCRHQGKSDTDSGLEAGKLAKHAIQRFKELQEGSFVE